MSDSTRRVPVASLRNVSRVFDPESAPVLALTDCSFQVDAGEFVAITGRSGSGKTTLLNILGLLDASTDGEYRFMGQSVAGLSDDALALLRSRDIGFVFQEAYLVTTRSVRENVELALQYVGVDKSDRERLAEIALLDVGLGHRLDAWPSTLSSGERQRVAIARALAKSPRMLICDEPTGNLDTTNAEGVMSLLTRAPARGCALVLVTHDEQLAETAPRRIHILDGRITDLKESRGVKRQPNPTLRGMSTDRGRRQRLLDYLDDVGLNIIRRPWHAVLSAAGVLLGVGLFVFSIALATTTSSRIEREFDLLAATGMQITPSASQGSLTFTPIMEQRLRSLPGIVAAGRAWNIGELRTVAGKPPWSADGRPAEVVAISAGALRVIRPRVDGESFDDSDHRLGTQVAMVGGAAASHLGDVTRNSVLTISGESFRVMGVIDDVSRVPNTLHQVLIPDTTANRLWPSVAEQPRMLIEFEIGAADQVAEAAPLVVSPESPDGLSVLYPPEAKNLRRRVSTQVNLLVSALAIALLIVGAFGIGNSTLAGILERRHEIGLRRALGARRRSILVLFLGESGLLGTLAGIAGLILGLSTLLILTATRRWAPVIPLVHIAVAPLFGAIAGLIAGVFPARHAAHLEPVRALRT